MQYILLSFLSYLEKSLAGKNADTIISRLSSNSLIDYGIASELDYVDLFRYKSIFQHITDNLPDIKYLSNDEIGDISLKLLLPESELTPEQFDKVRLQGLPDSQS